MVQQSQTSRLEPESDSPAGQGSGADYAELRDELARAVRRLCPRWLASRAEDLVQVALLRIFELRQRSEQERELSSFYLKRVAYSAMVDEIRRLERRRESPLETDDGEPLPLASESPGPEKLQEGREMGEGIRDCLGALLRPRQLAVTLYLQDVSVVEAARLLGWELKHTRNLVYRGLGDLRRCLQGKGFHP
ncbi:MAG TPA: RNA polymerase sigma factor [Thermoanaerobaculia bacterium]|nr:RNA polymerase sigma factor [Thermoanaerobaculia bacterium]